MLDVLQEYLFVAVKDGDFGGGGSGIDGENFAHYRNCLLKLSVGDSGAGLPCGVGRADGGHAHGGTVRKTRAVLHVGAHVVGRVDHRKGEGGGKHGRVGGGGSGDADPGGVDVVEVRRAEEAVAEPLLHEVVAAAVVCHQRRYRQLLVLV